jgi:hypothetical protein
MRRICPQCHGNFETQFLCPNCGIETRDVAEHSVSPTRLAELDASGTPGLATRLIAGLLLAQGIYYGVSQLGIALSLGMNETNHWAKLGTVANSALMLLAVLIGSLLAGAGNPRGMAAGAAMGLVHALALIGAGFGLGGWPGDSMVFAGWIPLTVAGAVGGRCGRYLWPAIIDFQRPTISSASASRASRSTADRRSRPKVPIAWSRVIAGAVLSIGCTVWAGQIRDYILTTSGGKFSVDSRLQLHFVTWVISALAMMVGGVFAGASTRGGIRHGILVGMIAAVGIFVLQSQVIKEALPAERFFASVLGLPESATLSPVRLGLFLLSNTVVLAMFGGWVGASLLPRVNARSQKLDRGSI